MKMLKSLLCGLLAAGLAASANADTIVRIVGSTAYRAGVHQSILDYVSSSAFTGYSYVYWGNSNFRKAAGAVFTGTNSGGSKTIYETYWTGSAAGCTDLAIQKPIAAFLSGTYYDNAVASGTEVATAAGTGLTAETNITPPVFESPAQPADVAMSDSLYSDVASGLKDANVSPALVISGTTYSNGVALKNAILNNGLADAGDTSTSGTAPGDNGCVGIVAFEWVLGNPGSTGLTGTSMGSQVAEQLASTGAVNFSAISNNPNDLTNFALLVGRNEDSGTRIDSLAECGFEPAHSFDAAPVQTYVLFSSTNDVDTSYPTPTASQGLYIGGPGVSATSVAIWSANNALNTEPSVSWSPAGHSGYIAGGDVAAVLEATNGITYAGQTSSVRTLLNTLAPFNYGNAPSASKIALIGYVGISDGHTATGGGGIGLYYNGIPYNANYVENGSYTLWAYEHMYYLSSSAKKALINPIADDLFTNNADIDSNGLHFTSSPSNSTGDSIGVPFLDMNVYRSFTEGGNLSSY